MKTYLGLAVLCLALAMPGCGWFRKTTMKGIDEYVLTVKAEQEATRKLLGVWPYRSCQLRAALGTRIKQFPTEATDAWATLDKLAKKKDLTPCDLGTASGCGILMTYETVRKAVELIAPDIIGLIPALL